MALTQEMWDQAITKGMIIWQKNGPSIDTSTTKATQPLPRIPITTAPIPPISQHLDPNLISEPNIPLGPTSTHRGHHPLDPVVIPAVKQLSHKSTTTHPSNHQTRRSSVSNPLRPNPSLGHEQLAPQHQPNHPGTTRYSTQEDAFARQYHLLNLYTDPQSAQAHYPYAMNTPSTAQAQSSHWSHITPSPSNEAQPNGMPLFTPGPRRLSITESMKINPPAGPSQKRNSEHLSPHAPRTLSTSSIFNNLQSLNHTQDSATNHPKPSPTLNTSAFQDSPTPRPQSYSDQKPPKPPPEINTPTHKTAPTPRAQPTTLKPLKDSQSAKSKNPPKTNESRLRGHNKPLVSPMAPKDHATKTQAPGPPNKIKVSKQPNIVSKLIGPPPYPPVEPQYIKQLPKHIQPYVDQIINVKGDGHCGFRAAAYCLGKGEGQYMDIRTQVVKDLQDRRLYYNRQDPTLDVEETINIINVKDPGPCAEYHWMSMPSMGRPLANAFQTAVIFYSNLWSETFFPDFAYPNDKKPIIIALIPSAKHFVAVTFKDEALFPAPRPIGTHRIPFSVAHSAWQSKYSKCIALYNSLKP
ncbi:uncharacterized protein PGTG_21594 [Puccinia graminis f. sp. tritici CRL 75-36-700-3]|uniref:OTU domain-containing protein n=1 Tax=Puccinia graminis f. sp. tritici (strain CRL 75-36-700-3 / race SCCL) TaxID=418459 RepID=H6QRX9_PUCGT|nr:uncharacterized protein PGTG_21594 [Puccinia graminis f. sp. tritici CRL 75-36-700-3]EHS63463.1 hypothetical protein PGTG_21594 [Puccinia graminis f. sp. tritici CRL 75-36-700-3]